MTNRWHDAINERPRKEREGYFVGEMKKKRCRLTGGRLETLSGSDSVYCDDHSLQSGGAYDYPRFPDSRNARPRNIKRKVKYEIKEENRRDKGDGKILNKSINSAGET